MQIVSFGDSLHEIHILFSGKKNNKKKQKQNIVHILSAELAQRVVKVKLRHTIILTENR